MQQKQYTNNNTIVIIINVLLIAFHVQFHSYSLFGIGIVVAAIVACQMWLPTVAFTYCCHFYYKVIDYLREKYNSHRLAAKGLRFFIVRLSKFKNRKN